MKGFRIFTGELRLKPPPLTPFWMVKKYLIYFILLNYIHHLEKQLTLHIIKYINFFSDKPDSLSLVSLLNGRLDFNRGISVVVSILFRSWTGVSRRQNNITK